jgi:amino acid adenylation domain-containing protein
VRLIGKLEVDELGRAFTEVVRRHESLRTRFEVVEGEPVQIIEAPGPVRLAVTDLSGLGEAGEAEAKRLAGEEARQAFDLRRGPLLRLRLLRLSEEKHVLLVTMHHIVSDGWSIGLLIREVAVLYESYLRGEEAALPELPVQYGDYAVWQREWLQGGVLEEQLSYWREQLQGAAGVLELPADRPRPAVQGYSGGNVAVELGEELTAGLKALSRREGVTLFMTLLAGFQALLHRYSGQEEIVVGTPVANRRRGELEGLIGFFVNTLALRVRVAGGESFRELLGRVREAAIGGYAHQDVPFERVVEELQPERSLSHTPLFQVMFAMNTGLAEAPQLRGLVAEVMATSNGTAKFDLTLSLTEENARLVGTMEYSAELFDEKTVRRLLEHYRKLLEGVVAKPEESVSRLPLLNETERQQLLVGWNDTRVEYAESGMCLHELFEQQAARTPAAVALVFEGEELSYRELEKRAEQLAGRLRSLGVGPEQLVGVCMERSVGMVVALLAILKAGGAYVPLDPEYPQERLAFMVQDAGLKLVLTSERQRALVDQWEVPVLSVDGSWDETEAAAEKVKAVPENLAYVIYTSGSTGTPKGAMNTHRAILNRLLWSQQQYQLSTSDRVLQKTTFSFDVSVWEFFWPLITGARLVLARPGGHQDPNYLADLIKDQQITTVHFVPSMLQVFLDEEVFERCQSLKRVMCSGEALTPRLTERFFDRLSTDLHNLYGPTEAAVEVTYWTCSPDGQDRTVPLGRPIGNVEIYVLGAGMEPVPVGVLGELYIGGIAVARGYFNRPGLTAEKFIPNPFSDQPGARLYKTGDVARFLPDGNVEFVGRADQQVKIRGYRIELGEIEVALLGHASVGEAAVVARAVAGGDTRLIAYLVAAQGKEYDIDALRSYLRTRLPEYMIPSIFMRLDELPLTQSGKVDRRRLPGPDRSRPDQERGYEAPRNSVEESVAAIWSELLDVEQVGVNDNFFELGGHSLLATQVLSRVREKLGVSIVVRRMFETPTVAAMAQLVARAQAELLEAEDLVELLGELELLTEIGGTNEVG